MDEDYKRYKTDSHKEIVNFCAEILEMKKFNSYYNENNKNYSYYGYTSSVLANAKEHLHENNSLITIQLVLELIKAEAWFDIYD